jgi:hypothetical protein
MFLFNLFNHIFYFPRTMSQGLAILINLFLHHIQNEQLFFPIRFDFTFLNVFIDLCFMSLLQILNEPKFRKLSHFLKIKRWKLFDFVL